MRHLVACHCGCPTWWVLSYRSRPSGGTMLDKAAVTRTTPDLTCHGTGSGEFLDDVIKWKHFLRYWSFVRGIHRSSVNSPHKGQRRRALIFSLILAWTNGGVNSRHPGDLWRHRAHHDVTAMQKLSLTRISCYRYRDPHIMKIRQPLHIETSPWFSIIKTILRCRQCFFFADIISLKFHCNNTCPYRFAIWHVA